MGCGITSSRNLVTKSVQKSRIAMLKSNNSVSTFADSFDPVLPSVLSLKNCLDSPPQTLDGSEILQSYELLLSLSINCADEFKNIKELSSTFLMFFKNSETYVHACCIPGFSLAKGLKALISFIHSRNSVSEDVLSPINKFPFFEPHSEFFQEFEPIEEFLYFTKKLRKNEEFLRDLLKVEYVLKIFESLEDVACEVPLGVKVLAQAAEEARWVSGAVERVGREMKEFFWEYSVIKEEAKRVGFRFRGYKECTVADIVHFLYSE